MLCHTGAVTNTTKLGQGEVKENYQKKLFRRLLTLLICVLSLTQLWSYTASNYKNLQGNH